MVLLSRGSLAKFEKLARFAFEMACTNGEQARIEADRRPQTGLKKGGKTGVEKNTGANTCND